MRFDPQKLAAFSGLQLKARYIMEGFLGGIHGSPFHGLSVEFSEYRDYQPGDDLRHLDWRLFARSDRLCIKRFEQETNARCYVICDTSASMRYRGDQAWGSKMECAQALATALSWILLKQNDAVGLMALDAKNVAEEAGPPLPEAGDQMLRMVSPSQKPNQFGILLGHLEALRTAGGPRLATLLTHAVRLMHRRSLVLFFSDLLEPSDTVELMFKQFRFYGHDCAVFQVLDRDEMEFPFANPAIFQDLETEQRRHIQPREVRETYLARFGQFMAAYSELFRQLEIQHCLVRTDEDPVGALMAFFNTRSRLK